MLDPIVRFQAEHARHLQSGGHREGSAVVLATADSDGRPSARVVLLRHTDARGFVFFTNYGSRKAAELDANPQAALCFYWDAIQVQVRVEGSVERATRTESETYFAQRQRGSQIGAWASRQSQPLLSREDLLARVERTDAQFAGGPVPCPPFWGGYRLVPASIEFWSGRDFRLHERERYVRDGAGWRVEHLQP